MANEEILTAEEQELTAEQIEDLGREPLAAAVDEELTEGALADEALEEVAGGAGQIGTKLFLVVRSCGGFNTWSPIGKRQIANFRRGMYLKNCRLVKVIGTGDWVNYAAFSASRNGPWTGQNGWTPADNCTLLAY